MATWRGVSFAEHSAAYDVLSETYYINLFFENIIVQNSFEAHVLKNLTFTYGTGHKCNTPREYFISIE